jgi:hypothetical protein
MYYGKKNKDVSEEPSASITTADKLFAGRGSQFF